MTDNQGQWQYPVFIDRGPWMIFFGILMIILGGVCALMAPLMLIAMIAAENIGGAQQMQPGAMITAALFYLALAAFFITMGIGSVTAKRWARALILVISWLWLVTGIIAFIVVAFIVPDIFDQIGKSGDVPPGADAIIKYITLAIMSVIYLLIPGALVLFYGGKNVKATFEYRDPKIRWTDKCPLPVLALTVIFAFGAFGMLMIVFYNFAVPFFGIILSGAPGAAIIGMYSLLLIYLTWGTYKLKPGAWWTAAAFVLVTGISAILTFSRVDLMEFYETMGYPEEQLELMRQFNFIQGRDMVVFLAVSFILWMGYLVYTRKFFYQENKV